MIPDTPGSAGAGTTTTTPRPRMKEPSTVEQKNGDGFWCQPSDDSLKTTFKSKQAARTAIALVVKTGEEYRIIKITEPSLKAKSTITLE